MPSPSQSPEKPPPCVFHGNGVRQSTPDDCQSHCAFELSGCHYGYAPMGFAAEIRSRNSQMGGSELLANAADSGLSCAVATGPSTIRAKIASDALCRFQRVCYFSRVISGQMSRSASSSFFRCSPEPRKCSGGCGENVSSPSAQRIHVQASPSKLAALRGRLNCQVFQFALFTRAIKESERMETSMNSEEMEMREFKRRPGASQPQPASRSHRF